MYVYYILSILVICLGIEVLFFIQKLEKLEAAYDTISACNIQDCEWTEWGKWGACSSTCDSGLRSRTRSCSNKISSSSSSSPKVTSSDGSNIQYEPCYEKRCPPVISVFSVSDPKSLSSPESLYQNRQFSTVHINEGEDFNPSTGIFTCSKPGVYYFTATLVKKRADVRADLVHCYIYKNTSQQLLLYVDPTDDDTDKGHAAISNSVVLRLDRDDIVYLGWCDDPSSSIEGWSSFSGFILYPD